MTPSIPVRGILPHPRGTPLNLNHGQDTRANRTRHTTSSSTQSHAKEQHTNATQTAPRHTSSRGTPGGKPQRLTARVKIASAPVFPTVSFCCRGQFPICLCVSVSPPCRPWSPQSDVPNLGAKAARAVLLRTRQPKFLHRPKRFRCDSDPAGAATPQIAPPTRAPAGRRLTDARHSQHARS